MEQIFVQCLLESLKVLWDKLIRGQKGGSPLPFLYHIRLTKPFDSSFSVYFLFIHKIPLTTEIQIKIIMSTYGSNSSNLDNT